MVTPETNPGLAVHGLVLLGTDTVYAVHMPTFTTPYDFQAVLRVTPDTDTYRTARKRYGTSALFTLSPRTLLLKDLEPGASFPADLYFGRFGREGELLGEVRVGIEERLYVGHPTEPTIEPAPLRYVLFGREQLYLAHVLTGPPDFDQVLTAQLAGEWLTLTGEQSSRTVTVPGRPDDLTGRLRPGEQVTAEGTELQVLAEVYLETADLAGEA
ncbi:hypothetical protein OG588_15760 [Streptomyces prunicolor]|uniref:hypothetical protein n=1 Tax=Streptomyces prunicolor TaxID=67348 RepID=UPI0038667DD2|nr:hypothetical protein OG588_15760 [Streptomyces prunicolor]